MSAGVLGQCGYGAGGRILFSTDSSFVAVRAEYAAGSVPTVCNHCFSYGFDLYRFDESQMDVFVGACRPVAEFDYQAAEFKVNTANQGKKPFTPSICLIFQR